MHRSCETCFFAADIRHFASLNAQKKKGGGVQLCVAWCSGCAPLLQLWAEQPRPCGPEFADCLSILAKTHSAGIFFQHKAISQVICLLPQGPLSIERILWRQREITSNSVSLHRCLRGPPWKIYFNPVFPASELGRLRGFTGSPNKAWLPANMTRTGQHTLTCGETLVNEGDWPLN